MDKYCLRLFDVFFIDMSLGRSDISSCHNFVTKHNYDIEAGLTSCIQNVAFGRKQNAMGGGRLAPAMSSAEGSAGDILACSLYAAWREARRQ